ncbi:hypothetical protein TCON_0304 [Astathelohania contejeani]|uniref:DUF866 domain-containing protein n=1 Tax=Astathelohania contejeani TaxID=164912 RepID=A0ABQ7I270_9MICR|nr:hypothetical protein TCON_0304 [Thelohania contejeani]
MKYNIIVEGTFQRIKNLFVEQTYPITFRCCSCGKLHEKEVIVSQDSVRYNDRNEKVALTVKCSDCKKNIFFYVSPPKGSEKYEYAENGEVEELILSLPGNNEYTVSVLEARGCNVEEVKGLTINVLTENGKLWKDVDIIDGFWTGDDKGEVSTIEEMKIIVKGI